MLHLLLYSLTVAFLHYFLTMPVGFNLNLTYRLKPRVSGIKIVIVYRRYIFQVESHYTTRTAPRLVPSACSAGFAPGWVIKYEYPVLYLNNFFRSDIKDCRTPSLVLCRFFYFSTICSSFRHVRIHMCLFTTSYK